MIIAGAMEEKLKLGYPRSLGEDKTNKNVSGNFSSHFFFLFWKEAEIPLA